MLKRKSVFLLFFFFLLFSINLFSQEYAGIKGVVKDSSTGETVPYAIIQVVGQNIGSNANGSGIFMLKGIKSGTIKVQVSAIGYQKFIKKINLKPDDFSYIQILLVPELVQLKEVTSESDRTGSTSLANISVQSIDSRELKTMPVAVERDVMKTLKVLPGVNAASDVTGQLFIRGGASDQNLVYCDNLKIANPFHAMGLVGIFNGDIVKSSDVITGGFDPEYGGRLSSVIKINTRDGNRNENKIKLNAGLLAGSATVEGPLMGGSYLLSYRRSYFDGILKKILENEVSLSFDDFFAKYTADLGSEGNMSISIISSSDDIDRKYNADPAYKWRTFSMGVTLQSFLSNLLLSWTTSYSSYKMEQNYLSSAYGTNSNSSYGSLSLNAKGEYQFNFNDVITAGLDMDVFSINNHFTNSYGFSLASGDNAPIISLYVKYKLACITNLQIDFGLRQNKVEFDNQNLNLFEPRFNLRYNITGDLAIKASATRMHQYIISNIDEGDYIPLYEAWICLKSPVSNDRNLTKNPLFPERADQYVLGVDTHLLGKYKFVLQGYYKDIKNFVGYNAYKKTSDDEDYVTGTGECKGIETFLKCEFGNLYGWLTYNLAWVEKENNGIKYAPRYDKRHSLSIVLGYTLPLNIKMGANWDFSTGMPFTPLMYFWEYPSNANIPNTMGFPTYSEYVKYGVINSRRLPCYHKLDLSFTRDFKLSGFPKAEVSLSITNVYDRANIFYYNRRTGKRVNMMPFMVTGSIGMEI